MKTDNALFHKGAYKQAMKQLALPAVLATAIMVLAQVLLAMFLDGHESSTFSGFRVVSFKLMSLPLIVVFLLVTPGMILLLSQDRKSVV